MYAAVVDAQTTLARNVASQGGRILIIGARPDNVPQDLWNHPRLLFYESTDDKKVDTREIPPNVKLIIFTRFLRHETHKHFSRLAGKRGIHCIPVLQSTGGLRRILEEAKIVAIADRVHDEPDDNDYETTSAHTPPLTPPPVPEGMVRGLKGGLFTKVDMKEGETAPKGSLKRFVGEFVAHYFPQGLPKRVGDMDSFVAEARHVGLTGTDNAIRQGLTMFRQEQRIKNALTADMNLVPASESGQEPATTMVQAVNPLDPTHPLTLDAITVIEDVVINLELLKEKLLTDYAKIDELVKARVKEKLKAFMDIQ